MNPFERVCKDCKGSGEGDSGGFDMHDMPVGNGLPCPACKGSGVTLDEDAICYRIAGLQNTAAYAAPELAPHLDRQIVILFGLLD